MANWVEPKSNYVATDQVTPDIFNTLAENEKFLYEIRCPMEGQDSDGNVTKINSLVFVETTTNGVYKAKYKKSDGTLVEIPIEASQSVKLKTSRSIGINGLDAESASFNGTSAVKIKVTGVPAELLYGTAEINITGNAASATNAKILESSWTAHDKSKYLSHGTYLFQVVIDDRVSVEDFEKAKAENIHTCLDTSGVILSEKTKKLLEETDRVLLDIKYTSDEEYEETFADTLSFLMTKIDRFDISSGYKAYSYCGTVCKNYLIFKINQFVKNQKRQESYDMLYNEISESDKYGYDQYSDKIQTLSELINETVESIEIMIENKEENKLNDNEIKVGRALIELFNNWEDLFARMGSNKFNKSSILMFIKELTLLSTPEIRMAMKKYKTAYQGVRKKLLDDIY